MDNLDDSENNAKISDSAYSNSCSNSQSRRSHSSKSTHSGSNSSGSSGYGGQTSTSGSSNQPPEKRIKEKDTKTKKQVQVDSVEYDIQAECRPPDPVLEENPKEKELDVDQTSSLGLVHTEKGPESMDISSPDTLGSKDEVCVVSCSLPLGNTSVNCVTSRPVVTFCSDGFSCVISMHDGVVMYTTLSLTTTLGFPKEMWIGRSFIDFIHPRDRSTFASQITIGLAVPKIVNGTQEPVQIPGNSISTMVCRIRRYRGLTAGFGVKERVVTFMPFLLKLSFKSVNDDKGEIIYLVIKATPFYSAFKVPNEIVTKPIPFVMRHAANGNLEYLDPESVPYLGYLPQDVIGEDALKLYHPDDLCYLRQVYEAIVKEGGLTKSKPYRMMTQNGDYITLETEWSSFINPWSRKLEFVTGKHYILRGPTNPDVFQTPEIEPKPKIKEDEKNKQQALRDSIKKILNEGLTKPAEVAKQLMSKRCQDLASFMETLLEEQPKTDEELRLEIQDADQSYYEDKLHTSQHTIADLIFDKIADVTFDESRRKNNTGRRIYNERDSMLGGISPHHDYNDSKSSTDTPLSYNQLNYNDNLQRYFDSHQPFSYEDYNTVTGENVLGLKNSRPMPSNCLSPMAQNSGDSADVTSSCESGLVVRESSPVAPLGDYQHVRLTENLITKHNSDMEKKLLRAHRGTRSNSKGEREKTSNENRQKKKEHLARCNASFQPAAVATTSIEVPVVRKTRGVKRSSKQEDCESVAHKHQCSSRQARRRHVTSAAPVHPHATITTTVAAAHWHPNPVNNMNTFILGVGMPQQMSIISPVISQQMAHMSGMLPMYYVPSPAPVASMPHTHNVQTNNMDISNNDPSKINHYSYNPHIPHNSHSAHSLTHHNSNSPHYSRNSHNAHHTHNAHNAHNAHGHNTPCNSQFEGPAMQCMMYGQAVYGSPFMYSPIGPQVSNPTQQTMMAQTMQYTNSLYPLGLASSNYEEACKPSMPLRPSKSGGGWRNKKHGESQAASSKTDLGSADSNSSTIALIRSKEAVPTSGPCRNVQSKNIRMRTSDEAIESRTDGESSYSSFYSSFFKTDSGSAEESGDLKKGRDNMRTSTSEWDKTTPDDQSSMEASSAYYKSKHHNKVTRRKAEPPWMEQVCVTSELIYKYQILTKTMEEVLSTDKQKMSNFSQPSLVNEQLGQLYLDLQLEGVAARLTLEEGITSSSSSGEETTTNVTKCSKKKREHSKLVMIYEEDAPLPPPSTDDEMMPTT